MERGGTTWVAEHTEDWTQMVIRVEGKENKGNKYTLTKMPELDDR